MLLIAPSTLLAKELSLFYAIYATYAAIAIFDFGLTNTIFVTGYINLSNKEKNSFGKKFLARLIFISFAFSIYGYFLLGADIAENLWAHLFLFSLSALFQYASLMILSYVEGNIDNKIAYMVRTLGEIGGCATLGISLVNDLGYLSIYSLLLTRSLPALILLVGIKGAKESKSVRIQCEDGFTLKLGVVMGLGYLASTGLINIIHWAFEYNISAAFSQMYLVQSTLFSICMSTFLYRQKFIKDSLTQNNTSEVISIKKANTRSIQIAFSLMSVSVLLGAELIKQFNLEIIKFYNFNFIMLYLFNLFLINNHVISIIFRMRGAESTFFLSVLAGLCILGAVFLAGYCQSINLLLYFLVSISLIINKYMTDLVFFEKMVSR